MGNLKTNGGQQGISAIFPAAGATQARLRLYQGR